MARNSQKNKKKILGRIIENIMIFIYGNIEQPKCKQIIILVIDLFLLIATFGLSTYNIFSALSEIVLFLGTILYAAKNIFDLYKRIFRTQNTKEQFILGSLILTIIFINLIMVLQFIYMKTISFEYIKFPAFALYLCLFFGDLYKIFKEFYRVAD